MPNWKKVIVSGSDALLNSIDVTTTGSFLDGGVLITSSNGAEIFVDGNITASGDISGSGALYASLSLNNSNYNTVMYNTSTGQFFYTGSYGGGVGGTGGGEDNDWFINNGTLGQINDFISASKFTRIDNQGLFINSGTVATNWGFGGQTKNSVVGSKTPGTEAYLNSAGGATPYEGYVGTGFTKTIRTYVTAEQSNDSFQLFPLMMTGKPGTGGAPTGLDEGYPYNYLQFSSKFYYTHGGGLNVNGNWIGNNGPGPGPVPEDAEDFTPGLVINGGLEIADYARIIDAQSSVSASYTRSTGSGAARQAVFITPRAGILFFDTGSTLSYSSSYLGTSASMQIGYDTGSKYLSIKAGTKASGDLKEVLFVSKSSTGEPRVGIGARDGSTTSKALYVSGTAQISSRVDLDDRLVVTGRTDLNGDLHNLPTLQRAAPSANLNTVFFVGNLGPKNGLATDSLRRYTTSVFFTYGSGDGGPPSGPGTRTFTVEDANVEVIRVEASASDGKRVIQGIRTTSNPSIEFFNEASSSVSGALSSDSASAQIKFDTGSNAVKFFAGSTNETLKEVLHISKSGDNPRIGIGTNNPIRAFDFKEVRDDNRGGEILIRGSRTTKGAENNDEVGRINFAIDSSSFGKIDTSGSAGEIVAIVDDIDETGVEGSLSFRVAGTKTSESIERLRLLGSTAKPIQFTGSADFNSTVDASAFNASGRSVLNQLRVGTGGSSIGTGVLSVQDYGLFFGGVHVGGSSDPGADNLIVDGTTTTAALTTTGNVQLSGSYINLPTLTTQATVETSNTVLILDDGVVKQAAQTSMPYTRIADGVIPTDSRLLMFTGSNGTKEVNMANGITYNSSFGWSFSGAGSVYSLFADNFFAGSATITNITASNNISASGNIIATGDVTANNGTFSGNITAVGDVIAQRYIVSSSVSHITSSFSSGSTIFGDDIADTHQFTGSLNISGTLSIPGFTNVSASLATIPTNNNQLTNGAGYTTNTGTVTSVGTGNGLTGTVTTTGNISVDYAGTGNIITNANANASGYSAADDFIIRYNENDEEVQKTSVANFKSGYNLVDTSGTPADNQIAVFTDADTIEGTSKLTFSNNDLLIHSSNADNSGIEIFGGVVGSAHSYISPVGSLSTIQFGDGETGHVFDLRRNKLAFDGDSTNTYIQADSDDPENLEIHADNDIELKADNLVTMATASIEHRLFDTGSTHLGANGAVGDIVKFGGTTTTAGAIYYLKTDGTWANAQANAVGTATASLAVAVGTNSTTDGMCLRGFINPYGLGDASGIGSPVYLHDGFAGRFKGIAPDSTGDVVRILGYQYGSDLIYFNPSNDFIVHT